MPYDRGHCPLLAQSTWANALHMSAFGGKADILTAILAPSATAPGQIYRSSGRVVGNHAVTAVGYDDAHRMLTAFQGISAVIRTSNPIDRETS
jgi:C1A family cysteine protease